MGLVIAEEEAGAVVVVTVITDVADVVISGVVDAVVVGRTVALVIVAVVVFLVVGEAGVSKGLNPPEDKVCIVGLGSPGIGKERTEEKYPTMKKARRKKKLS